MIFSLLTSFNVKNIEQRYNKCSFFSYLYRQQFKALLIYRKSMLELSKSILKGVSFDEKLFKKELHKIILWLGDNKKEYILLKNWCYQSYLQQFPKILEESFSEN